MVLALQTAYSLAAFGGKLFIGRVVSLSLVRELGPVLTALMVGGRVGAGITAELGSMTVTEQVDALRAMAVSPVKRLVTPRVIAVFFMLPLLTALADLLGILGGLAIAVWELSMTASFYFNSIWNQLRISDIASGLGKSFFFALRDRADRLLQRFERQRRRRLGRARHDADGRRGVDLDSRVGLLPHEAVPRPMSAATETPAPSAAEAPVSPNDAIVLRNVRKTYEGKSVLSGATLAIRRGETMVVLGPSGTGKSVLLRHINGLTKPDSGNVFVCGEDIVPLSEEEHRCACGCASRCFSRGARFSIP